MRPALYIPLHADTNHLRTSPPLRRYSFVTPRRFFFVAFVRPARSGTHVAVCAGRAGRGFRRPDMIRRYQFEIILTLLLLCGALTAFFYW
ncbi:FIG00553533: hypothetical protein [Cronobacter condimenti 1330]|uniref:Uncharacterized protein n=1 Tax=Cronobacter condimenti 1330 TaxID=1073999 RepID=K8A0U7_9ENTR|nr:FIG00553533: hypothetical protein [Cronobacter condimenti 1330]